MSCSIHFHTEIKINGKWEHYSKPNISTSYFLFSLLAGVRSSENSPKMFKMFDGITPDDVNIVTRKELIECSDTHSLVTYNSEEIIAFYSYIREEGIIIGSKLLCLCLEWDYIGYIDGHCWDILNDPDDAPEWLEDVRWIIGFDN